MEHNNLKLTPHITPSNMTQDDKWQQQYDKVMNYMLHYKRRPSKHRIEDHLMLNWIKYNKKQKACGKMAKERIPLFNKLLDIAEKYRKINQNAYANQASTMEAELFGDTITI